MQKYGFTARIQDEEKESEIEQQLDKKALNELMEAAMKDGAIMFNAKYNIRIAKEKRKIMYATEYTYILRIAEKINQQLN